ncbi:hypothetical protein DFJ73DRAFT_559525 [Zopfochytrium polystomum]|nr:hypothetical protein DFJ73DRAFT_559525 [Zopfochytrium polystomum]
MLEWTHRPQPKGKGRSFNPDIVHPVAPRMPPPNSVIEEVFEYERRIPTAATFFLTPTNPLSGFSSLDLTPADLSSRGPLWSRNQHTAVASLESVQLPDGPHSPSGDEWIWCSGWMLDTMRPDVDQLQGWQYSAGNIGDESDYLGEHRLGSTSYQRLHSRWVSNPHMLATGSIFKQVGELNLVRRRRWIRVRRRLASRHNDVLTVEPGPGQEDPVQTTVSPNGVLPVSQGDQSDISMPTRSPGLPSAKEPPSGSNSPKSPVPISPPAPQRNLSGLNGNPAHNDRLRQSRSPWRPPPVPVKEASARWTTFQQPSSSHSSFPLPLSDFFLVGANSRTSPAKLFSDLAATVTTATQGALNSLAGAVEGAVVTALNAVGLDDEEPEWTALSYDTQLQPRPQATPATKGSANLAGEPGNGDGSAAVLTEPESSGTMGECPVCHLALNKLREQPPCGETGLDAADSHVAECLRKGTNGAGSATAQPRGSRFFKRCQSLWRVPSASFAFTTWRQDNALPVWTASAFTMSAVSRRGSGGRRAVPFIIFSYFINI